MILAWENLRRFLWCCSSFCCYSSFVDVFHFVVVSLFDFQATLPCRRHSTLAFQTCEGLHQLWALPQLLFIAFFFSSTASITVLSGHFLPTHRRFLPYVLSQHFWHIPTFLAHFWHFGTTYFYQGFTGSRQSLSWKLQGFILILKTQTRSISLFDSE